MLSAVVQEQERGLGGWHAEWEVMPQLIGLAGGALHHLTETMAGLAVDANRMQENLNATNGLIFAEAVQMALANAVGRMAAHELVEAACKRAQEKGRNLRDVLAEDVEVMRHLTAQDLERLFDARQYLGVSDRLIERVLQAHSSRRPNAAGDSE
jgi:3-carboxy-cis,cis-muconate cycloisomerase